MALVIGMMQAPNESNDDAEFVVVFESLKLLTSRDLFEARGTSVTQIINPIGGNIMNNISTQCSFETR